MSVTTTENPATHTLLRTLADYDLHHSGSPTTPKPAPPPNAQPSTDSPEVTSSSANNPDWWPEDYRRIPDYRPANPNLDREQRPDGVNAIERAFISTMFLGVATNAVSVASLDGGELLGFMADFYDLGNGAIVEEDWFEGVWRPVFPLEDRW